jgi:hypothetical protein
MLKWKVVAKTLASFASITFALCVLFGLLVPTRFHPAWLLEAILPGFTWLTMPSFLLGVTETAVYGAWAGVLFTALYNYFARGATPARRAEA